MDSGPVRGESVTPWGAAIAAVGAIAAGSEQKKGAKKAASAQQAGQQAAIDEQRAAREEYQRNIQPYLGLGTTATGTLQELQAGDFSRFRADPSYQFAQQQALEAVKARGAAGGNYAGGGTTSDLARLATGLASQQYGDYYNRLYNLATLGQNAAAGAGSASLGASGNISNLLVGQGNTAAQGAYNQANIYGNTLGQLGQAAGQYFGNRGSSPYASQGSIYNFGSEAPSQQQSGGFNNLFQGGSGNFGG